MTFLQLFRRNLIAPLADDATIELRAHEGWIQWRQTDDNPTWANLFEIPADGADGLNGLPGAPGASVELREYFDTLQWRNVGTEVWNHLVNLSELAGAAGADGREIELYIQDESIYWRYVGETEGTLLIPLADITGAPGDCGCEDEPAAPTNSAQMRCGVSVRVTEALKAAYDRAKLDPDAWDELQSLAGQAQGAGAAAVVASQAIAIVLGTSVFTGGIGLFGSLILGAGTFFGGILGLTNDNTDQFTPTRQDSIQQGLYCVLTRQETADITPDVLREWISYIADSGLPTADRDIVLAILAWTPLAYWRNEALVAAPEINPCSAITCVAPDDQFAYEFSGEATAGFMRFIDPLAAALMTVIVGRRDTGGIVATATPLNTMRFNVRVNFGRIIPLAQIELEVAYNQTRAATSVITIAGEGFSSSSQIEGIDQGFLRVYALAPGSVSEFSISGEIATAGEFDADAYLDLFQLKVCGEGFPPWGVDAINADLCGEETSLCEPIANMFGFENAVDLCFRESTYGWTLDTAGYSPAPSYEAGVGWKTGLTGVNHRYRQFVIRPPRQFNNVYQSVRILIELTYESGTQFDGSGLHQLYMSDDISTWIDAAAANVEAVEPTFDTGAFSANFGGANVYILGRSGYGFQGDPFGTLDPGGTMIIHRLTILYNGSTPPYTVLPEDTE